jgi:hypothetical protein
VTEQHSECPLSRQLSHGPWQEDAYAPKRKDHCHQKGTADKHTPDLLGSPSDGGYDPPRPDQTQHKPAQKEQDPHLSSTAHSTTSLSAPVGVGFSVALPHLLFLELS